ncbi:MAG: LLM class flavin-dependent oxidoreductase [Acidimicrobiaceae bacterium]|nr:LLM class flavin-dependent oxidoreductase [Acidimicrobiaceae bacterium]MXW77207.1 LLM class flavin-dependent oxidoreductase [Acidimicrobiaceae bacterium]MYA73070.1 LLM class flavin-dependent oxidoreductase [Acidimicrobiaceae bacterium]MYC42085.1 LLM class flavin-dependent oxidoreductase [Acidimicrobiaceae bacterium]MYD06842.1 LLM class flavin-dependent oxidoreductase [Acidimicrobiaceae bacterium]
MFILRFDFRLGPQSDATMAELYGASLEMCEWGEANGAMMAMFSEHHSASDGYLPSPIVMAAAAAARTTSLSINVGALLALMYDPVKLAEDMVVLDHLSAGRVSYTVGLGYRAEEYAMFGVDSSRRGVLMDEHLDVLKRALAGERFDWRGRSVHVTPEPLTPGGPMIAYGGGTVAAARRAGRRGMMLFPQHGDPALAEAYDQAALEAGNPTGMCMSPGTGSPTSLFVSDDTDAAWQELGPHLLHDAVMYKEWMGDAASASASNATTVDELRTQNGAYRIATITEARQLRDQYGALSLQPLCGGIPPETAWPYLKNLDAL